MGDPVKPDASKPAETPVSEPTALEKASDWVDDKFKGALQDTGKEAGEAISKASGGQFKAESITEAMPFIAAGAVALTGTLLMDPLSKIGRGVGKLARNVVTGFGYFEKIPLIGGVFSLLGNVVDTVSDSLGFVFTAVASFLTFKAFQTVRKPLPDAGPIQSKDDDRKYIMAQPEIYTTTKRLKEELDKAKEAEKEAKEKFREEIARKPTADEPLATKEQIDTLRSRLGKENFDRLHEEVFGEKPASNGKTKFTQRQAAALEVRVDSAWSTEIAQHNVKKWGERAGIVESTATGAKSWALKKASGNFILRQFIPKPKPVPGANDFPRSMEELKQHFDTETEVEAARSRIAEKVTFEFKAALESAGTVRPTRSAADEANARDETRAKDEATTEVAPPKPRPADAAPPAKPKYAMKAKSSGGFEIDLGGGKKANVHKHTAVDSTTAFDLYVEPAAKSWNIFQRSAAGQPTKYYMSRDGGKTVQEVTAEVTAALDVAYAGDVTDPGRTFDQAKAKATAELTKVANELTRADIKLEIYKAVEASNVPAEKRAEVREAMEKAYEFGLELTPGKDGGKPSETLKEAVKARTPDQLKSLAEKFATESAKGELGEGWLTNEIDITHQNSKAPPKPEVKVDPRAPRTEAKPSLRNTGKPGEPSVRIDGETIRLKTDYGVTDGAPADYAKSISDAKAARASSGQPYEVYSAKTKAGKVKYFVSKDGGNTFRDATQEVLDAQETVFKRDGAFNNTNRGEALNKAASDIAANEFRAQIDVAMDNAKVPEAERVELKKNIEDSLARKSTRDVPTEKLTDIVRKYQESPADAKVDAAGRSNVVDGLLFPKPLRATPNVFDPVATPRAANDIVSDALTIEAVIKNYGITSDIRVTPETASARAADIITEMNRAIDSIAKGTDPIAKEAVANLTEADVLRIAEQSLRAGKAGKPFNFIEAIKGTLQTPDAPYQRTLAPEYQAKAPRTEAKPSIKNKGTAAEPSVRVDGETIKLQKDYGVADGAPSEYANAIKAAKAARASSGQPYEVYSAKTKAGKVKYFVSKDGGKTFHDATKEVLDAQDAVFKPDGKTTNENRGEALNRAASEIAASELRAQIDVAMDNAKVPEAERVELKKNIEDALTKKSAKDITPEKLTDIVEEFQQSTPDAKADGTTLNKIIDKATAPEPAKPAVEPAPTPPKPTEAPKTEAPKVDAAKPTTVDTAAPTGTDAAAPKAADPVVVQPAAAKPQGVWSRMTTPHGAVLTGFSILGMKEGFQSLEDLLRNKGPRIIKGLTEHLPDGTKKQITDVQAPGRIGTADTGVDLWVTVTMVTLDKKGKEVKSEEKTFFDPQHKIRKALHVGEGAAAGRMGYTYLTGATEASARAGRVFVGLYVLSEVPETFDKFANDGLQAGFAKSGGVGANGLILLTPDGLVLGTAGGDVVEAFANGKLDELDWEKVSEHTVPGMVFQPIKEVDHIVTEVVESLPVAQRVLAIKDLKTGKDVELSFENMYKQYPTLASYALIVPTRTDGSIKDPKVLTDSIARKRAQMIQDPVFAFQQILEAETGKEHKAKTGHAYTREEATNLLKEFAAKTDYDVRPSTIAKFLSAQGDTIRDGIETDSWTQKGTNLAVRWGPTGWVLRPLLALKTESVSFDDDVKNIMLRTAAKEITEYTAQYGPTTGNVFRGTGAVGQAPQKSTQKDVVGLPVAPAVTPLPEGVDPALVAQAGVMQNAGKIQELLKDNLAQFKNAQAYQLLMRYDMQRMENSITFLDTLRKTLGKRTEGKEPETPGRTQLITILKDKLHLTEDEAKNLAVKTPDLRLTVFPGVKKIDEDGMDLKPELIAFGKAFQKFYGKEAIPVSKEKDPKDPTIDPKNPQSRFKPVCLEFDEMSISQKREFLTSAVAHFGERAIFYEDKCTPGGPFNLLSDGNYAYGDNKGSTYLFSRPSMGIETWSGRNITWKEEHVFIQETIIDTMIAAPGVPANIKRELEFTRPLITTDEKGNRHPKAGTNYFVDDGHGGKIEKFRLSTEEERKVFYLRAHLVGSMSGLNYGIDTYSKYLKEAESEGVKGDPGKIWQYTHQARFMETSLDMVKDGLILIASNNVNNGADPTDPKTKKPDGSQWMVIRDLNDGRTYQLDGKWVGEIFTATAITDRQTGEHQAISIPMSIDVSRKDAAATPAKFIEAFKKVKQPQLELTAQLNAITAELPKLFKDHGIATASSAPIITRLEPVISKEATAGKAPVGKLSAVRAYFADGTSDTIVFQDGPQHMLSGGRLAGKPEMINADQIKIDILTRFDPQAGVRYAVEKDIDPATKEKKVTFKQFGKDAEGDFIEVVDKRWMKHSVSSGVGISATQVEGHYIDNKELHPSKDYTYRVYGTMSADGKKFEAKGVRYLGEDGKWQELDKFSEAYKKALSSGSPSLPPINPQLAHYGQFHTGIIYLDDRAKGDPGTPTSIADLMSDRLREGYEQRAFVRREAEAQARFQEKLPVNEVFFLPDDHSIVRVGDAKKMPNNRDIRWNIVKGRKPAADGKGDEISMDYQIKTVGVASAEQARYRLVKNIPAELKMPESTAGQEIVDYLAAIDKLPVTSIIHLDTGRKVDLTTGQISDKDGKVIATDVKLTAPELEKANADRPVTRVAFTKGTALDSSIHNMDVQALMLAVNKSGFKLYQDWDKYKDAYFKPREVKPPVVMPTPPGGTRTADDGKSPGMPRVDAAAIPASPQPNPVTNATSLPDAVNAALATLSGRLQGTQPVTQPPQFTPPPQSTFWQNPQGLMGQPFPGIDGSGMPVPAGANLPNSDVQYLGKQMINMPGNLPGQPVKEIFQFISKPGVPAAPNAPVVPVSIVGSRVNNILVVEAINNMPIDPANPKARILIDLSNPLTLGAAIKELEGAKNKGVLGKNYMYINDIEAMPQMVRPAGSPTPSPKLSMNSLEDFSQPLMSPVNIGSGNNGGMGNGRKA